MLFMEASALTAENVDKVFIRAAREIFKGVVTMKYESDASGEIPGVKEGNT